MPESSSPAGRNDPTPSPLDADVAAVGRIEAVQKILEVICRSTGMGFSAVARVTETKWVACAVRDEIAFGLAPGGELELASTICDEIRQSGQAVAIDHVAEDEAFCGHPTPARYGFQSYLSVPIHLPDGEFFGTLCAIDPRPAKVNTPATVGMFKLFADLVGVHLDADRRTVAERAVNDELRAERELLRTVFDQAPDDAILIADVDRVLTAWNPAAERITGWSAAEAVGQTADIIFTPEDRAAGGPAREVAAAAADGKTADERWHARKDGGRFWGSGTMNALHAADGAVSGFLKVFRDATERHEQAEALTFLGRVTDVFLSVGDPDRITADVARMLGEHLSASRVLLAEASEDGRSVTVGHVWATPGMPSVGGTHRLDDYGERILADYKALGRHVRRDARRENPPGPQLDALVSIRALAAVDVPVYVGGRLRAMLSVHQSTPRDWTGGEVSLVRQVADRLVAEVERARAGGDLTRSEARLRAMVTASSDVLYRMSPDWSEMWQLKGGSFIADTLEPNKGWLDAYIHPDDRPLVRSAVADAIAGKTVFDLEHRVLRVDGTTGWTTSRAIPLLDESGEVVEWFGAASDISDRKRAEAEREHLLDAERAARAEAEQAGRMKDEFLATLSHELRTPLNAISGWVQILRRGGGGVDPDDLAEGLAVIERNARAQTQIIEDILDMSRIVSGKLRLDVRRVDLAAAVRAGVETVQPAADAKGIRLQVLLDPAAGPVAGDPGRLHQVFWNLLNNAVKFTPRGGRVQVLLERVNSHVEVSVIDTGEGIEPAFLPHVFDRFRQADASTTRRHGGLGLGLAIVKQLVELHGGRVRARSGGKGSGATFGVELPLMVARNDSGVIDGPTPREHPTAEVPIGDERIACDQLRGVSVLVVDDEADGRAVVQRLLEECGATVRAAASAADALALIAAGPVPDVLISDIGMPELDGYDLIRQVRSLPAEKGGRISAAALTAYARPADRVRAMEAGFQMHLAKPVEPAELILTAAALAKMKPR